ncbi:ATP-dependent RNA helicase TDRD9-like [Tachypleus tridentatus]
MALLPLDVRLSRLIMLGHVFGCLRECIIIAASLHLKSFFSKPFGKLLEAYKSRLAWADGSFSDCLAFLKAYNVWEEKCQSGDFQRPGGQTESQWAFANFIQLRRIKEVAVTVKELIPIRQSEYSDSKQSTSH